MKNTELIFLVELRRRVNDGSSEENMFIYSNKVEAIRTFGVVSHFPVDYNIVESLFIHNVLNI